MDQIARRTALAGAATLALAAAARKPRAQVILTPKDSPPAALRGLDALVKTTPPATLPAQPFTDADGKPVTLADFAGSGVLLNLWATWCGPCVAEMPALDALAGRLHGSGIVILPVSSDRGAAPVVRRFYATHAITRLGIWLDPKGLAARGWGARGLPTTLIIDRRGREVARLEGGADWSSDAALDAIRSLVA